MKYASHVKTRERFPKTCELSRCARIGIGVMQCPPARSWRGKRGHESDTFFSFVDCLLLATCLGTVAKPVARAGGIFATKEEEKKEREEKKKKGDKEKKERKAMEEKGKTEEENMQASRHSRHGNRKPDDVAPSYSETVIRPNEFLAKPLHSPINQCAIIVT